MAIVGWILLSIILLLITVILLVLFFPIFYRLEFRKTALTQESSFVSEKADEQQRSVSTLTLSVPVECSVKVSWLFGLIRALFDYPKPCKPIVKVAFFTVFGKEGKQKAQKKKGKSETPAADLGELVGADHKNEQDKAEALQTDGADETEVDQAFLDTADDASREPEETQQTDDYEGSDSTAASATASVRNAKAEGTNKKGKLKSLRDRISKEAHFYHALWLEEDTKPFVKDTLTRVLHILKNVMPRSIRGRVLFGAGSPDVTGYVYGGYCVGSSMFPKRICLCLEPDFERQVFEGEVVIKGHFMVFTLILDGLRVFFDRRLKKIRRKIKHHQNKMKSAIS